jgi:hypothetical protein
MRIASVAAALAMALPASVALGQTAQDRQACMADVLRLCASAIPNREQVIACMLKNRNLLGSQCRAVVARYNAKPGRDSQQADTPAVEHTVSLR